MKPIRYFSSIGRSGGAGPLQLIEVLAQELEAEQLQGALGRAVADGLPVAGQHRDAGDDAGGILFAVGQTDPNGADGFV